MGEENAYVEGLVRNCSPMERGSVHEMQGQPTASKEHQYYQHGLGQPPFLLVVGPRLPAAQLTTSELVVDP